MAGQIAGFGTPGIAKSEIGESVFSAPALTIQDTPALGATKAFTTETAMPAFTPVALASGQLVPINYNDDVMDDYSGTLVGVTTGEVTAESLAAGGGEVSIDVYRSGYFNAAALNFDSTINTFELQEGLFDGGPELLMIGQNPRDVAHQAEVAS